jgi:hypothetical protein
MTYDEVLAQVLDLLQRERRISYRALKRRFSRQALSWRRDFLSGPKNLRFVTM